MKIDRETILTAALEMIDESGLEGLSLRRLGQRLGVSHMAAYRHFADREAIVDALADQLLASIRLPDPAVVADPEELVFGYIRRARERLLAHPALVPVVTARPLARSTAPEDLVRLFETFRALGFPDETIAPALFSLVSVTLGLVLYEQQRAAYDAGKGSAFGQRRAQLVAALQTRPDAPQAASAMVLDFADPALAERVFEATIRDCYDGLRRRAGLVA